VHFDVTREQVEHFANGRVEVAVAHENYAYATELSKATKESLLDDLRG
jgi:hypothetical protein